MRMTRKQCALVVVAGLLCATLDCGGGQQWPVAKPAVERTRLTSLSWSSSGRQIAFMRMTGDGYFRDTYELWVADLEAHRVRRIAGGLAGTQPSWFPDDERVLVWRELLPDLTVKGQRELDVVSLERGSLQPLQISNPLMTATVSPDGGRVAFVQAARRGSASLSIWVYDLRTREAQEVTTPVAAGQEFHEVPRWSPDGKRIAFVRIQIEPRPVKFDIFVVHPDGSGQRPLTTQGDICKWKWGWISDSRSLVFATANTWSKGGRIAATASLYRVSVEGGKPKREASIEVAQAGDACGGVAWDPLGKRAVFVSRRDAGHRLMVLNLESGEQRRLLTASGIHSARWAPDGKRLALVRSTRRGDQLLVMDVTTGGLQVVFPKH